MPDSYQRYLPLCDRELQRSGGLIEHALYCTNDIPKGVESAMPAYVDYITALPPVKGHIGQTQKPVNYDKTGLEASIAPGNEGIDSRSAPSVNDHPFLYSTASALSPPAVKPSLKFAVIAQVKKLARFVPQRMRPQ